jgi:hypothetical protein
MTGQRGAGRDLSAEVNRKTNQLYVFDTHIILSRAELRQFIEDTNNFVMARGQGHTIKSKHVGAGMYEVSLVLKDYVRPSAKPGKERK